MDKTNPVTICSTRVIPKRNPMFHRNEIEKGVGRFTSEFLVISIRGSFITKLNFFILL